MSETQKDTSSRAQREQEFYDEFRRDPSVRQSVSRFYQISTSIFQAYEKYLLKNATKARVLEYGCGTGCYAFLLSKQDTESVVGIDISPVAISQAEARAQHEQCPEEKLSFTVMNAENLTLPSQSIDLICGSAILHHLDLEKAMSSIAQVLNSDGKAIFIEPLGHNPLINQFRKMTPKMRTEDEKPLLVQDIEHLSCFFEEIEVEYFYFLSLVSSLLVNTPFFKPSLKLLEVFDRNIFKIKFFQKYAWQALIKVSKPKKLAIDN